MSRRAGHATIALIAGIAFATAAMAQTQDAASRTRALAAAANQLADTLDAAEAGDPVPTLKNADGALVRTAFDRTVMRESPLDVMLVSQACIAISRAMLSYLSFGGRAWPGGTAAFFVEIQDEIALAMATANLCIQRSFRAVAPVFATMDDAARSRGAEGLSMMRIGARQTIEGTLMGIGDPGTPPANRAIMLDAMLDDPAAIAESFAPKGRAKLRETILEAAATASPEDRKSIEALAAAFDTKVCNSLCANAGD